MSVVTTEPQMGTSVPATSNARLHAGGSPGQPCDGAGRRVERRRAGGSGESALDVLTRLPAVVVLERIPVPTLAVGRDGVILFANTAFAEMVGYRQDGLAGLAFAEVPAQRRDRFAP